VHRLRWTLAVDGDSLLDLDVLEDLGPATVQLKKSTVTGVLLSSRTVRTAHGGGSTGVGSISRVACGAVLPVGPVGPASVDAGMDMGAEAEEFEVVPDDVRFDVFEFREASHEEHAADARVADIRDHDRRLDLDTLEKRARRRRDDDRAMMPLEREYRAAMARENESPLACMAALEAILALHADDVVATPAADAAPETQPALWLDLIRRPADRRAPTAAPAAPRRGVPRSWCAC
jgi:hypothetical protein